MKMSNLKAGLLFMALFAVAALTSCKKDDDTTPAELKEQIAGTWDISSFKVGGTEYMDIVVEEGSIEYKAFTGAKGDFVQTVKYVDEDPEETIEGEYEVLSGTSVKMTADGESYTVKITIDGDNLQLEGKQDGKSLLIKAEKRQ